MVDFELYRIFKTVADEENITKASKKLNISQPAITKQIKNLETILNINLFDRTNTGVKLTQNGRNIYEEIKEHVIALENVYKKYSQTRKIYLGIHAAMLNKNFDEKITHFINEENQNINVMNYNTDEMLSKLEKQEIDIAISKKHPTYNNEKIEFIKLGELHDVLIVNSTSNWVNKKLSIDDFKNIELYLPRYNSVTAINFFESTGLNESDFKSIRNISYITMLDIIKKNNNAIGLITKEYIMEELANKSIIEIDSVIKIKPIEYGMYKNKENIFKELNVFIDEIIIQYND